jgi:DNA-binding transcriptional MerR regulator
MVHGIQIGEASKRTSLSIDAIRFYEKRALLPTPTRTTGRFRLYTASDLSRLKFICQMQGFGFSLNEIKQLLDLRSCRQDACASVRALLRAKLDSVRKKINGFEEARKRAGD